MPYTPVLTARHYHMMTNPKTAKRLGFTQEMLNASAVSPAMLDIAEGLVLTLPGIDWTIEVDLMGHHRITIHFKGIDLKIDE